MMNTPRMILLRRHRAVEPRLDEIRQSVLSSVRRTESVAAQQSESASRERSAGWSVTVWRELIWSCRRAWAGLALIWLVVLGLNITTRDEPSVLAVSTLPPSPEVLAALREQGQLLSELLKSQAIPAEQKRESALPPRRSDRRSTVVTV